MPFKTMPHWQPVGGAGAGSASSNRRQASKCWYDSRKARPLAGISPRPRQSLETVYRFKQQLKEIWTRSSSDQAKRMQRLQAWCTEAEKSGIQALQLFANNLRGYTLQLQ